jgi:hypothetical protein
MFLYVQTRSIITMLGAFSMGFLSTVAEPFWVSAKAFLYDQMRGLSLARAVTNRNTVRWLVIVLLVDVEHDGLGSHKIASDAQRRDEENLPGWLNEVIKFAG